MSTPEAPTFGPCSDWISGADVAASGCDAIDNSGDPSVYDDAAHTASQILWAASGRQYTGTCETTVRPCVKDCSCWGFGWGGLLDYAWNPCGWWIGGGGNGISAVQGWIGCGQQNGCCGHLSRVKLSGYPVTEIVDVKIDGNIVPPEDYRLDKNKWLTYLDDEEGNPRHWPACQHLARDDDEPGTFSVTYLHGIAPPQIGLDAAVQLACHLAAIGEDCELPPGTTGVDRQGIRIELALRSTARTGQLPPGFAALSLVQLFLETVNPNGNTRRSAFWTPDGPQYAQRYG